jgi:hypothetical protein
MSLARRSNRGVVTPILPPSKGILVLRHAHPTDIIRWIRAQITSIPTLMAFKDGVLVFSQPGALPADALEQVITAVRDLDMDQVRKDMKQRSAS